MITSKYVFNNETLSYDKIELSIEEKIKKIGTIATLTIIVSALITLLLSHSSIQTSSDQVQIRENNILKAQYQKLEKELNQANKLLSVIQVRDDSIYRRILDIDPLSSFIRQGGYGGTDRYANLRGMYNSGILISTSKHMDYILKQAEIQQKSYENLMNITKVKKHKLSHLPALMPISLKESHISSRFGYRRHPILKKQMFHEGIDFSAPKGTKIYAPGDGVVEKIKLRGGYGKQIIINHGYGFKTRYAHLNKIFIKKGQKIKRGDIIAEVGSTGLSTGPHLHYEVFKNNIKVNPRNYFFDDITPEIYAQIK